MKKSDSLSAISATWSVHCQEKLPTTRGPDTWMYFPRYFNIFFMQRLGCRSQIQQEVCLCSTTLKHSSLGSSSYSWMASTATWVIQDMLHHRPLHPLQCDRIDKRYPTRINLTSQQLSEPLNTVTEICDV